MLREATRLSHERVDAAFGTLGLDNAASYARFLRAHARALPAAEAGMMALPPAQGLVLRAPLLAADLAELGEASPPPLPFAADDEASAWGTMYVVEGSRLGGAMLARMVPDGLPRRYLAATHPSGGWRTLRAAIDAAAADHDAAWRERMVAAALACFDLYATAAEMERAAA